MRACVAALCDSTATCRRRIRTAGVRAQCRATRHTRGLRDRITPRTVRAIVRVPTKTKRWRLPCMRTCAAQHCTYTSCGIYYCESPTDGFLYPPPLRGMHVCTAASAVFFTLLVT
eukprot:6309168-Pyramimonas_sp.AAC.4